MYIHVSILPQSPLHPGCDITLSRVPCAIQYVLGYLFFLCFYFLKLITLFNYFYFYYFFWGGANYSTISWWFSPYIDMNQPWVHMCPPILNPSSHLPPHTISQGCPRALALSALLHALNLHWSFILHMAIYTLQCCSLTLFRRRLLYSSVHRGR